MSRVRLALAFLVIFVAISGTIQQQQPPAAVKQQPRMMGQQLVDPSRPCSSNPCQNGAKCTDQVKDNFFGYSCACVAPWGGVNCDQNKNDLTERSQRASMMMGPMGPMGGQPNFNQYNMNMQQPQANMMQQQQQQQQGGMMQQQPGGMMRPQQQGQPQPQMGMQQQQQQQQQHPDQRQVPPQQGQQQMGMPPQGNFMPPQGQNMPSMHNGQMTKNLGPNGAPNDQSALSLQNRQLDNTNKMGNAQNPAGQGGANGDNRNKKDWDNYNGIWPNQGDMNNWVGYNDRWNNYGGGYNGYNGQYNNNPGNYNPGYGGYGGYNNNFNNYNSNPLYQNSWQNGYNNVGCMSSPCMNNGYCVPNGNYGYSCNCAFSYYGHRCQFRNTGAVLGVVLGTILPVTFIAIVAVGVFIYIRRKRAAK